MNPYENAPTTWKLWDVPSEGPGMNSRNHIIHCTTLIESNQVIWSANTTSILISKTAVITVHIGSGQYEFQTILYHNDIAARRGVTFA
ncbi:hypothetical protein I4U23_022647 [Adineta vaga]|nr:hypothetical protein I4U23_022647 [Adineta vaga]